ncbi:MAG: DNA ligase D, partial [Caldimonas sp.]
MQSTPAATRGDAKDGAQHTAEAAGSTGTQESTTPPAKKRAKKAAALALPQGAVAAPLPATLEPQLATLVSGAPAGDDWAYEVKFDGYRILARIDRGDVRLLTRNGKDWTAKLAGIARELAALDIGSGWLDGEIVVLNDDGASDFGALQNAFDAGAERILYFVFDLPYCGGHDLRAVPLEDRRALLAKLLAHAAGQVRYSPHFRADAAGILRNACRLHLEGLIGKRLGSGYVSGRSPDWIKLKCTLRQEFVIGGYTEPKGSRSGLGALLLGIHDESGRLRYAGNVGTGFDTKTLAALRKQLSAIEARETPFVEAPREARGTWVEPKLVAEVSFAEWTRDGKVRQAVFHGLRSDKPAEAVGRELPAPAPRAGRALHSSAPAEPADAPPANADEAETSATATTSAKAGAPPAQPLTQSKALQAPASTQAHSSDSDHEAAPALPASVHITHPERVIDPGTQRTKRDLVDYYVSAARRMLPHLAQRPVALVRAPGGIAGQHFFQKHAGALKIDELRELAPSLDPGHPPLIEIDSFAALISAAQMNVVEFHTWNATSRAIEKPDRMIFDLDPGAGVRWPVLAAAAKLTKTVLEELGLRAFLKTSGGKGLHIVVPLAPRDGWDEVKDFSRNVVELLSALAPDKLVAKSGAKNRVGKIFVDYLRNGRGATTAAA